MGNITYLNRNGASGSGQALIDNLTYNYYKGGSRLAKVSDGAPAASKDQGFKDGTNTGQDYTYDGNGNLTYDYNKRISITYNRLNLPVQITSGTNKVVYYYNFLGEKYKKVIYTGSTVTDTRYYLDEIEYKNNAIDFTHTSEGRAIKNGTNYYYEYALTDQTGSTRVTFADRGNNGRISTEQISAYYPYGLQYSDPGQTRTTSPQNLYTYEGNETQQDLNMKLADFNARQYDPAIGRFISHDPDDQFADLSPYAAMGNNPINNVDPSGRSFFDLAVGLAGLGAVIGGIADGSSSGKGFFAGLAAGFIAGIVGREGIGGITSIGLNLGTGGYNDLGSSKGFFGKTQKTLGDLAGKAENLAPKGPALLVSETSQSDNGFKPFSKSDLATYSKQAGLCIFCDANDLGKIFEEIFRKFESTQPTSVMSNFRRNTEKFELSDRSTVPDFTADVYYEDVDFPYTVRTKVPKGMWYEVQAKYGALYSSSNLGQIKGHIDNLFKSTLNFTIDHPNFYPGLAIITTSDVSLSQSIYSYAAGRIKLFHGVSSFKIINGTYYFNFTETYP